MNAIKSGTKVTTLAGQSGVIVGYEYDGSPIVQFIQDGKLGERAVVTIGMIHTELVPADRFLPYSVEELHARQARLGDGTGIDYTSPAVAL